MASGGARAHSGPAPDPDALRRDRPSDGDWITLPAAGRQGDPPEWPLTKATMRELVIWEREWKRPQATQWEQNGLELEVALYVRTVRLAESPKAPVNARTLVKQQMEALGISLPGLYRNRWRIADVAPSTDDTPSTPPKGVDPRQRFAVVTGGTA